MLYFESTESSPVCVLKTVGSPIVWQDLVNCKTRFILGQMCQNLFSLTWLRDKHCIFLLFHHPWEPVLSTLLAEPFFLQRFHQVINVWSDLGEHIYACSHFNSTAPLRSRWLRLLENTAIFANVSAKLTNKFHESSHRTHTRRKHSVYAQRQHGDTDGFLWLCWPGGSAPGWTA